MKMLTSLFITSLFVLSAAQAASVCTIKVFSDTFEGQGQTEMEAKINARIQCVESNNPMHCELRKAVCEKEHVAMGPTEYCEIVAFSDLFYDFGHHRDRLIKKVTDQCKRENHEMHCKESKVDCYSLK